MDGGNNNKAAVIKYTGKGTSGWQAVGGAGFSNPDLSADFVGQTSLALDSSGTPFIAFRDYGNANKVTVMKYTGIGTSGWQTFGNAGFSVGEAFVSSTSLALDSTGTPFVVFSDVGNMGKATVMKNPGSGWQTVGSAGFSAGVAGSFSLVFDSSKTPIVAYMDDAVQDDGISNKATVMKYTGNGPSGWQTVGSAGFSTYNVATHVSLALDSSGTPFVAYNDGGNDSKITVMKYTGIGTSGWQAVGSAGFSTGAAYYTSLALDSSGTPFVAYMDMDSGQKAMVMKYTGSGTSKWQTVGNAGLSAGQTAYTSLALSSSGTPFVAYTDYYNSAKATVSTFG